MPAKTKLPRTNEPHALEPFEGQDVIGAKVAITKAGDGLSDALAVEPTAFPLGSKLYVVLEVTVDKVRYVPVKDTGSLVREHTLAAQGATFVDEELVGGLIDQTKELVRKRKEEEAGIQSIPFGEPDEDADEHAVARELLDQLKKDVLRKIADANGIVYRSKATASDLIDMLVDGVIGIEDVARHAIEVEKPDSEATVTPISQAVADADADFAANDKSDETGPLEDEAAAAEVDEW